MAELEKAFFTFENESANVRLSCLFNPETIGVTRSNEWNKVGSAKSVPELSFEAMSSGEMDLMLFFDTTHNGSAVTRYTSVLLDKMEIDTRLPGTDPKTKNGRPPWVQFHWGRFTSFKAVITKANIKFLYFSSEGVPLRASVDLDLRQFQADDAFLRQNPTSGTPHPHRTHRVQRGETLDRISAQYYGDSTQWRVLAAANGIEDPLAIRPGSLIGIPQPGA
jgi:hypothetical protein